MNADWEVEVEVHAGLIWGDRCVSTELTASSWEQTSAPRPMAVQLQGVAEVGKQATLKLSRKGADLEAHLELDALLLLLTG